MALRLLGYIDLPAHARPGGFDHAAVHGASARLYVAHTANDALDVIDCTTDRYLHSLPGLAGVAGALVSDERNLVFTSNRDENTVGIFAPDDEAGLVKVAVGMRPNGLAYDPGRHLLLAANVGDPAIPGSCTVSIVNVAERVMIADLPVPGRTRWAIHDPLSDAFYVNIMAPACIVVVGGDRPTQVARLLDVPAAGPHGLELDAERHRLFCACDGKSLVTLAAGTGRVLHELAIGGVPDVIFFNAALQRLYIAIGDPGVIDVIDTGAMTRLQTVSTEKGAHTIAWDAERNKVYAFLPQSHRAAVYADEG